MTTQTVTHWHGCYDDTWKGTITDEAFAHPAKFAPGLINRIADHLKLPRSSVVVDPFGGVGLGGIVFASRGVHWIGCELEEKFVKLAKQNFELHRQTWEGFGDPLPMIVQGDSRRLRENLKFGGAAPFRGADCVVSSPPFQGCAAQSDAPKKIFEQCELKYGRTFKGSRKAAETESYGTTPGQLGNMKPGEVDAVVSSPPYEGSLTGNLDGKCTKKNAPIRAATKSNVCWGTNADGTRSASSYSESLDNIGNQTGDTFWTAARDIVAECHAILKPGGLAVWVCKDFIRKGERVPFSDDWERLCVSCGFEPMERIHAQLVRHERHPSLFGGEEVTTKERKSFFRRLAESKGSPPIDHEDVIVMSKQ